MILNKNYVLMHKDYPVLSFNVSDNFRIKEIGEIYQKDRIPLGIREMCNEDALEDWFFYRSISEKRTNFRNLLKYNNAAYKNALYFKDNSVSVTDCYWLQKNNEDKKWEDVNFYDSFGELRETIYLGIQGAREKIIKDKQVRNSPNIMSNGNVPKMWFKKEGRLYLIKGSEGFLFQEPFNEISVSQYLDKVNIPHVQYSLDTLKGRPFSICENMLEKGEELIPAYYICPVAKYENRNITYNEYIQACCRAGLNEDKTRKELDNMLIIDYITANLDRHWFNFGVIRDAETLHVKRLAPLYDHGLALFAKVFTQDIAETASNVESASFNDYLRENLKMVQNTSLLENTRIGDLSGIYEKVQEKSLLIDADRIKLTSKNIELRIHEIKDYFGFGKNGLRPMRCVKYENRVKYNVQNIFSEHIYETNTIKGAEYAKITRYCLCDKKGKYDYILKADGKDGMTHIWHFKELFNEQSGLEFIRQWNEKYVTKEKTNIFSYLCKNKKKY